ncbi:hypothetical protein NXS19_003429 [Fusarium pseudograminearum]|nr:hypothetical protein NXS19_003429 [Fusarium pseudograminearum]
MTRHLHHIASHGIALLEECFPGPKLPSTRSQKFQAPFPGEDLLDTSTAIPQRLYSCIYLHRLDFLTRPPVQYMP